MRYFFVLILVLSATLYPPSAGATNYPSARIERYVKKIPRSEENSLYSLVKILTKPLDDDYDKAKAIAFWIASHINYDEYYYTNGGATKLIKQYRPQEPQDLLKSRVGICGDFASLFQKMCKIAGIKAEIVHGYAYPYKKRVTARELSGSGHAWNLFHYNSKKIYVDTTFMAKGTTGTSGGVRNLAHRKALREIQQDNKYKSQINDFDDYYFDFDYKKEIRDKNYAHKES